MENKSIHITQYNQITYSGNNMLVNGVPIPIKGLKGKQNLYYEAAILEGDKAKRISRADGSLRFQCSKDVLERPIFEFPYPEFAGATIRFDFYINKSYFHLLQNFRYIEGCEIEGTVIPDQQRITDIHWSEVEPIVYGKLSTERTSPLCLNEDAFLHIHSANMCGQKVFIELFSDEVPGEPLLSREVQINNNILSLYFSMEDLVAVIQKRNPKLVGSCKIFAKVQGNALVDTSRKIALLLRKKNDNPKKHNSAYNNVKVQINTEEKKYYQEIDEIVRIGVFFDGTRNNRTNAIIGEEIRREQKKWKEDQKRKEQERREREQVINEEKKKLLIFEPVSTEVDKLPYYEPVKPMPCLPKYQADDPSFANDQSNIALLEPEYNQDIVTIKSTSVYIEGVGTLPEVERIAYEAKKEKKEQNKESKNWLSNIMVEKWNDKKKEVIDNFVKSYNKVVGEATGLGKYGVIPKMKRGCDEIIAQLEKLNINNNTIKRLVIDVYGFSRGAAVARNFTYEVLKPGGFDKEPFGYLGECLKKGGFQVDNIEVHFVGLYDTVSSYGIADDIKDIIQGVLLAGAWGTPSIELKASLSALTAALAQMPTHDENIEILHLNSIGRARRVVQLRAADEYRVNFSITDISSAGGRGTELVIPGSHADVGGGYPEGGEEVVVARPFDLKKVNQLKDFYADKGWFTKEEMSSGSWFEVRAIREKILKGYSYIPLYMLAEKGNESRNTMFKIKKIKNGYPLTSSLLMKIYNNLNDYADNLYYGNKEYSAFIECSDLRNLRHDYLHWSSNINGLMDCIVDVPRKNGDKYERKVYNDSKSE